jgi:hypothetical protein
MSGFPRVTTVEETVPRYEDRLRRGPEFCLREMSRFFMKKGALYKTLRELVRRLDRARIPYAIVGAMALPVYGVVRATEDIHLLLTEDGLRRFRERFLGRGFVPAFAGATRSFRFAETGVRIDIVVTGEYPGDGRPKAVRFPDPQEACIPGVRVFQWPGSVFGARCSALGADPVPGPGFQVPGTRNLEPGTGYLSSKNPHTGYASSPAACGT